MKRVALSTIMTVAVSNLTACLPSDRPRGNVCIVHADRPHKSSFAAQRGQDAINAKGWFACTEQQLDLTIRVWLEAQTGGTWQRVPGAIDSQIYSPAPVTKKSKDVVVQ